MNLFTTLLLFTQAILSLSMCVMVISRESTSVEENSIVIAHLFMVFLWNIGYVMMLNSPDEAENLRYVLRSIIMFSIMFSIILSQYFVLLCISISEHGAKRVILFESLFAMLVYPIIIARDSITFVKGEIGWTYTFNEYAGRNIYNVFIATISLGVFVCALIGAFRGKRKRDRLIGRSGILCVIFMTIGMSVDTILPIFGYELFPGSAIGMFLSVCVIYSLFVQRNVRTLTVRNVSPYIFHGVEQPMIVVDEDQRIVLANDAMGHFLSLEEDSLLNHDITNFSLLFRKKTRSARPMI